MGNSLAEYASCQEIILVLVKERAKARKANKKKNQKGVNDATDYSLDEETFNTHYSMALRRILGRIMPPRRFWRHPRYHSHKPNNSNSCTIPRLQKQMAFSNEILFTIKHDTATLKLDWKSDATWEQLHSERTLYSDTRYHYLYYLADFCLHTQQLLKSGQITFSKPVLVPILKSKETVDKESDKYVFRPLSVYNSLQDKVILSITCRYLTKMLDKFLHKNILSYRAPRRNEQGTMSVPDYHDGVRLIKQFRAQHRNSDIYVADFDIRTFYDTINHNVVRTCFSEILEQANLQDKEQVMSVLNAYLQSYSFYKNVRKESEKDGFWSNIRNKLNMKDGEKCCFKWISEDEFAEVYGSAEAVRAAYDSIGVPQGGSLSLIIANVVLNHVDNMFINDMDASNSFFCRYCDDMVLMSTNENECKRLIGKYKDSLYEHKLLIHEPSLASSHKCGNKTLPGFWLIKSHEVRLWGAGDGEATSWIGFLGYELCRTEGVRLRRSTIDKHKKRIRGQYSSTLRRVRKYVDPAQVSTAKWERMKGGLLTLFLTSDGVTNRLLRYTELDPHPTGNRSFQLWQQKELLRCHRYWAARLHKWLENHQAEAETDEKRKRLQELLTMMPQ